jgi:hypothetical protein
MGYAMVRRILLVGVVAVLAPLTLVAPAEAKGPQAIVISGPGIESTRITYANARDAYSTILDHAFPWPGTHIPALQGKPPLDELGPMYVVTYRMPPSHAPTGKVQQSIYPFADGGPVTFTPPGQQMLGMRVNGGWHQESSVLTEAMRDLGADPHAPGTLPAIVPAAQAATDPADSESAWPWIAAGAAGVGVLIGAGALWRTRHRPSEHAG